MCLQMPIQRPAEGLKQDLCLFLVLTKFMFLDEYEAISFPGQPARQLRRCRKKIM